jgi:amino acid efflux transporter
LIDQLKNVGEIKMDGFAKFKPTLKLSQVTALYIGAVLGSGILIIPGLVAEVSGPASLLAWGLMVVVVLPMALTMGLLSAKYPDAGGVSHFVSKAFNAHIGSLIWLVFFNVCSYRGTGSCSDWSRIFVFSTWIK